MNELLYNNVYNAIELNYENVINIAYEGQLDALDDAYIQFIDTIDYAYELLPECEFDNIDYLNKQLISDLKEQGIDLSYTNEDSKGSSDGDCVNYEYLILLLILITIVLYSCYKLSIKSKHESLY